MAVFTVRLEKNGREPMYEQLYAYIRGEIMSGRIACGEKLMSKKNAAKHLGVSVVTVETAYAMLMQEGYIRSEPRSGYYVCHNDERPDGVRVMGEEQYTDKVQTVRRYTYDFRTDAVDTQSFPYSVWLKLTREVMSGGHDLLTSGDCRGDAELRYEISRYLHEYRAVNCSAPSIVVGAGLEYLMMLICALLGKGNVYGVENPSYPKAVSVIKSSRSTVKYIDLDEEGLSIDSLERSGANVVYITPSHQFPTGTVMSVRRRKQLLAWASREQGRYIIEDDYNGEFNLTGRPFPSLQGMDGSGRVIYMSTFSRVLASSVRIAYMVLPRALAQRFYEMFGAWSSTVPRFEQHTLAHFIGGGYMSRHMSRMRNIYKRRRDVMIACVKETLPEAVISGTAAGTHIIIHTPRAEKVLKAADEADVHLYAMSAYYGGGCENEAIIAGYGGMTTEEIRSAWSAVKNAIAG